MAQGIYVTYTPSREELRPDDPLARQQALHPLPHSSEQFKQ